MLNIGLLMTCDEEDCIREVMDEHTKYFDTILCLDGSSDKTEEIIRSYPQVKYFLRDKDIINQLPNRKIEDGARQFLLEKAQELFGCEGWFTLLHGDEIFYDNPVKMAERAEREGAEKINWSAMNFFMHTSDFGKDWDAISSVQKRVTWYCPGFLEIRSFKNKKGIYYKLEDRHKVLPYGIGWHMFSKYPVYKHYPFRSVAQMRKKKEQHTKTGFAVTYRGLDDEENYFKDILPGYKIARQFDGSFHEFEVNQQRSILARWLRAHRYMPCRIGPWRI